MKKYIFLSIFLVLFDQWSKFFAQIYFEKPFVIIKNLFSFSYSQNSGIAFSIDIPIFVIIILNLILIPVIIYFINTELNIKHPITKLSLALIVAGAIGNLIDRFLHGFVIDFISVWTWPIFNMADMYVSFAVLLILAFYARISRINKNIKCKKKT